MDDGFELNKPHKGPVEESLFMRLIWMIVIALMCHFPKQFWAF